MSVRQCPICHGKGSKRRDLYVGSCRMYGGTSRNPAIICPRCQGKGHIIVKPK